MALVQAVLIGYTVSQAMSGQLVVDSSFDSFLLKDMPEQRLKDAFEAIKKDNPVRRGSRWYVVLCR
jgi:hypothetical protein